MERMPSSTINPPTHPGSPLLEVSHRYGADPAFVLAGGGNTSAKHETRLWIKGSGHALATIGPDGFVELDREKLQAMLAADWPTDPKAREALFVERVMASRVYPELKQRPSVESLLHHLMPESLVVHTHPGAVNALTCCARGEELAKELFGHDVLWQPYVDPGLILAQSLSQALNHYRAAHGGRAPSAIFLANHGLIVGGEDVDSVAQASDRIVSTIQDRLKAFATKDAVTTTDKNLLRIYSDVLATCHPELSIASDDSESVRWLVNTEKGVAAAMGGPLTPDQIVYCRSVPLFIDAPSSDAEQVAQQWADAWRAYETLHGFAPWVAIVAGAGVIAFRESAKLAEITKAVYADATRVYHDASRLGGIRHLGARDRKFIEEWEVEAHRRSVMTAPVEENFK